METSGQNSSQFFINAWLTIGVLCGGSDYSGQSNVTLALPAPTRKTWYVAMGAAGPSLPEQKATEYVSGSKISWLRQLAKSYLQIYSTSYKHSLSATK